jgi:hypothetical protein
MTMENDGSLSRLVQRNLGGRTLFLAAPVAAGAAVHAVLFGLAGQRELGMLAAVIVSAVISACAAWRWLDEDAAVAVERLHERAALVTCAGALPLFLISPALAFAGICAGLASFGASCGIVRITAYSVAPEPPAKFRALARLAWLVQTLSLVACIAAPTPAAAVAGALLAVAAVMGATMLPREELAAVME